MLVTKGNSAQHSAVNDQFIAAVKQFDFGTELQDYLGEFIQKNWYPDAVGEYSDFPFDTVEHIELTLAMRDDEVTVDEYHNVVYVEAVTTEKPNFTPGGVQLATKRDIAADFISLKKQLENLISAATGLDKYFVTIQVKY